ncbi:MAG TPA: helix-turn-helix domain-containing protein [Ilumatobacteraceae bacterium]|nr:helix-turn-helix domain-containing protein [Ilumatobacteraceae bacterium]
MTVTQAATVLGISRTSAYECVRRGEIPSLRLGGRIIVPTQAVEELLNFRAPGPAESPENSLARQRDTLF